MPPSTALRRLADDLSARTFQSIAQLVYQHSRICLTADKRLLLANRLRARLVELGIESFDAYSALLASHEGSTEIDVLVDLVSINHTQFFREIGHFEYLTNHILPTLVPKLLATGAPLRLWSAAASSGEEPYTMAMVVAEYLREHPGLAWQIEASDISWRMLAAAEQAIYPAASVTAVPPVLLRRYFQRGLATRTGSYRIQQALRAQLHFERINLFQSHYPVAAEQQVIFCRNVMIYFDERSRLEAVQRLARHLAPGGYLVIGYSESLLGLTHGLTPVQQGIYQRT